MNLKMCIHHYRNTCNLVDLEYLVWCFKNKGHLSSLTFLKYGSLLLSFSKRSSYFS